MTAPRASHEMSLAETNATADELIAERPEAVSSLTAANAASEKRQVNANNLEAGADGPGDDPGGAILRREELPRGGLADDEIEPTPEELATLRRVSDSFPISAYYVV